MLVLWRGFDNRDEPTLLVEPFLGHYASEQLTEQFVELILTGSALATRNSEPGGESL